MNNEKLKQEITKRWRDVLTDTRAHAQLEYILMEAGLLAKPRKRRKKTADENAQPIP